MKNLSLPFLSRFHSWLFMPGDPATLALLRIVFCAITFLVYLVQAPLLSEFYGVNGLLSPQSLQEWQGESWTFRPLQSASFSTIMMVYFVVLLTALCGALGFFTRTSLIVLFLGILALQNRNPLVLNSGDILLRLIIFYLACSRCGSEWSLDALKRMGRAPEVLLWPQRLIQIQIALVYFTTVWFKMQGPLWREGTVTWYVSRVESLQRFPVPDFLMTETASIVTTWGTLGIELALCTLVWFKPYRKWVLLLGLLLHGVIEYQLNIPFFGLITVSSYLSHFSGTEIRGVLRRCRRLQRSDRARML